MKRALSPRYFLASIALLLVVVALHAVWTNRRTRQEMLKQFEETGLALAEALETSSRSAVRGNALMEEMIAQRLLDNARLIDQLLSFPRFDPAELQRIAATNHLRRVDLLDRQGGPYVFPAASLGMMGSGRMREMMMRGAVTGGAPGPHPPMPMYMWGRRWGPAGEGAAVPSAIQDRKFWEGSLFGVAIGARSFPGIIAVHADADYVLNFRKEMGVERQIEELARQSGIESIALLDGSSTVLAHSDPERVGQREADEVVQAALTGHRTTARLVRTERGQEVFEVLRPVALGASASGLLRIRLSTAPMDRVWRRDRDAGIVLGLAVLAVGVLGLGAIFYTQHRHLREIRALEEGMARSERLAALGNMAATVAHEIRNPLNAVSMGLQRLGTEFHPPDAEDYRRLVTLMQGEVSRLNTVVGEFLSLARPVSLDLGTADLAELLGEVAALVEPEAKAAGIEVVLKVPADLPGVRADRGRLKQVLLNVALNAIQAMPGGGTLGLEAAAAPGLVNLTVSDTGGGIPPELLPRVFEPYVTTKTKGLGLGLAVARQIVEAHGGRIEAESDPGRGSRFRITLPLSGRPGG